ncbi:MAG: hypothetical protein ACYTEL_21115 [Planctomycetota bacterium]|jgi:hypothetical protein
MNRQVLISFILLAIFVCSAAAAAEPQYYVKTDTWQESMRASRLALARFELEEFFRQAQLLQKHRIKLGPWYSIGPFMSPNADPFGVVFGPEVETGLDKTYENGKLKSRARPWPTICCEK